MDPSSITLVAFSSALVLVSGAYIVAVNYKRCVKPQAAQTPVDWVSNIVSQDVRVKP